MPAQMHPALRHPLPALEQTGHQAACHDSSLVLLEPVSLEHAVGVASQICLCLPASLPADCLLPYPITLLIAQAMSAVPAATTLQATPSDECDHLLSVRSLFVQWASTTGHAGSHLHALFARAGADTSELWRIVLQSVRLEEAVASGCLVLQALALVRLWMVENQVPCITNRHERVLCDWCQ
jgi:hypothetical protein